MWAEQNAADALRKSPSKTKKAGVAAATTGAMKGFSKGEKDLYRQAIELILVNLFIKRNRTLRVD